MYNTIKNLFLLIPLRQRGYLIGLQILIIFNGILEMLSIFSIVPFLTAITNFSYLESNQYFKIIIEYFELTSRNEIIFYLGIFTITIYSLSVVIGLLSNLLFTLFGEYNAYYYTSHFYKYYLSRNLLYHKEKASSLMIKNLSFEIQKISSGILLPALRANSKIVSCIFILALLIAVNPAIAISAIIILSSIYLLIYHFIKNIAYGFGKKITIVQQKRYRIYNESFLAIKDILFTKTQALYTKQIDKLSKMIIQSNSFMTLISQAPRVLVDLILFNFLILILMILITQDEKNFNDLITPLALFGFASYKLVPNLQQIFLSVTTIKSNLNAYIILKKELKDINLNYNILDNHKIHKIYKSINLKNIYFSYPKTNFSSLSNISLKINVGNQYAIIGATGSGKTTLVDLILGLISPTKGIVSYDNKKATYSFHKKNKLDISYVSQNIFLTDVSIKDNILFGSINKFDEKLFKKILVVTLINEFLPKMKKGYNTKVGEMGRRISGGQKQRIGIARALYNNSNFIIFDEATSAIDNLTEMKIYRNIEKYFPNKTIIVITHRVNTAKKFDQIIFLNSGKIDGIDSYENLVKKNVNFQELIKNYV